MLVEKYIKKLENMDKKLMEIRKITPSYLINSLRDCYQNNKFILEDINKWGFENVIRIEYHIKICRYIIKLVNFEYENHLYLCRKLQHYFYNHLKIYLRYLLSANQPCLNNYNKFLQDH